MIGPAEYKYLLVELEVKRGDADPFEELMRELLPAVFEKAPEPPPHRQDALNWRLLSSIRTSGGRLLRYLHLWQVPRDVNLLDAMLIVGKNSRYYDLNVLSVSERQDLFNAAVTYSPLEGDEDSTSNGRGALMRRPDSTVIVEMASGPADWFTLHEWQDAMPVLARDTARDAGLRLVFALQSESGQLRRYLNFWRPSTLQREVTEAEARDAITKRNIKLSELGAKRYKSVATPAEEQGYYFAPYNKIVASSFRVYKEVNYR